MAYILADIPKCILLNENHCILIKIPLKGPMDYKSAYNGLTPKDRPLAKCIISMV